ncbi:RHS repeat-associated core domain-containing protein [Lysobacter enzymogenes]
MYVESDHLGTPRAVIDPTRNTAIWNWNAKSEVFGNDPPNQDPDMDGTTFVFNMRFPGQRFDVASGLAYNYFRDYDAITGRYIQSDPIGLRGGISTYLYANGSPTQMTDRWGLASIVTYMKHGVTYFLDDNGEFYAYESLSTVAPSAKPGAGDPYTSADTYPTNGPYKQSPVPYGPNDILKTDDSRGRWLHGGGSGLPDPLAPRQGWRPAVGCTRLQNEDVQELVNRVREYKAKNPGKKVPYVRTDDPTPPVRWPKMPSI